MYSCVVAVMAVKPSIDVCVGFGKAPEMSPFTSICKVFLRGCGHDVKPAIGVFVGFGKALEISPFTSMCKVFQRDCGPGCEAFNWSACWFW